MAWETEQQRREAEQRAMEEVTRRIGALSDVPERATVRTVYGEPMRMGDRTIIPIAEVSYTLGFGMGQGRSPGDQGQPPSGGSGGGGGTRVHAKPLALCEVSPDGVRLLPVIDRTRLAVWSMASGIIFAWLIAGVIRAFARRK